MYLHKSFTKIKTILLTTTLLFLSSCLTTQPAQKIAPQEEEPSPEENNNLQAVSFASIEDFENSNVIDTHKVIITAPEIKQVDTLTGPVRAVPKSWHAEIEIFANQVQNYPDKYSVDSTTYNFYDTRGILVEQHYYTNNIDYDGNYWKHFLLVTTYHYENGLLTEERRISAGLPEDLERIIYVNYTYTNGKLTRKEISSWNGISEYSEYSYENGLTIEKNYHPSERGEPGFKLFSTYEYDSFGNEIGRFYVESSDGMRIYRYQADFDEEGKKIESRSYDAMMGLLGTWYPEYDPRGNMIFDRYIDNNGNAGAYYRHYYDNQDRLIRTENYNGYDNLRWYKEYVYYKSKDS